MGWGDEIIASGQARVLNEKTGRRVVIRDRDGRPRWNDVWENNPRIYRPGEQMKTRVPMAFLTNGPGARPYIAEKADRQWTWKDFECPRGEIYFSEAETKFAEALSIDVLIEPTIKAKASPNKDWGRARWVKLAALLRAEGLSPVQVGPLGSQPIEGAQMILSPSFRHGCAVLARARVAVLHEGGLHHAAAALGVPAVVIFGGFISPRQTGYVEQTSLFTGETPCGMRVTCAHCAKAMAEIEPETVLRETLALLRGRGNVQAPRDLAS